jgi:hypothetical protein
LALFFRRQNTEGVQDEEDKNWKSGKKKEAERRMKQKEGLQHIPFTSILYNLFPRDPS